MIKKRRYLLFGILVTIVIITGISFAYWYNVFYQNDKNAIVTDCFKMSFLEDSSSNIQLEKSYPILDEEGRELKPYKFQITNICTSTNTYQINMESLESSSMPERVLKVMVNENKEWVNAVILNDESIQYQNNSEVIKHVQEY